ncbi:response regulator receiver modulated diguanylate cyclase/phosphodiesterase [Aeromonas diversa CDC 2478-85]|uniref:cyclic-guanylate-specific phosphodiesterase n=1 Tax=Aeromonas diversa CDC 2478-85 TaxID=1268237 RepID=N9VL82_9GAMM|nr:REC domain-containing phosphodiesterase [Aeromonas diversa]ENY72378.1 response regulator receiver modulated diguanylate cyclase/phosphodiesterase [Aeromonas diversa CDC 2478-85]
MDRQSLHALIVEDEEDDLHLLLRELRRSGYEPDYVNVDSADALRGALRRPEGWDIVFSDFSMPNFDGLSALSIVRQHDTEVPFIFVSGTIGEELAVQAVRSGAQDYILKGNLKRLSAAVPRELREADLKRRQRKAEERIEFLANYDELTGLANGYRYHQQLESACEAAKQQGHLVGLILIQLNSLGDISSSLGHKASDRVVQLMAARLVEAVGEQGLVARLGGDQFALILPTLKERQEVMNVVCVFHRVLCQPIDLSGYTLRIQVGLGISIFPIDGEQTEQLQANAALALNESGKAGPNACRFYLPDLRESLDRRLGLERDLDQAIGQGGFTLHYQPQIDLAKWCISGAEALLRWPHPERGFIPPDRFIPVAEETGLILPLGQWVLAEACRQAHRWHMAYGQSSPRVAVNFSAFQFRQSHLVESVMEVLQSEGLSPERLEVEITESALMQEPETTRHILERLRDLGVSISLDDFGTGYSSLSYLKRFPVNVLKIDKSFIQDIPQNGDDMEITRAILAMAARLNIKVVAEGVETRDQLDFLRNEGCDLVQGYYFSRPVAADDFLSLLSKPIQGA